MTPGAASSSERDTTTLEPSDPPDPPGPRERLMLRGEQALSDEELLAVLLGTGSVGEPVAVVAARLLSDLGGPEGLRRAGINTLSQRAGVGPIKACRIRAALELGARAQAQPLAPRAPVRSSKDVHAALGPRLATAEREHFYALALDAKHRPLSEILIAVGGLTACGVAPADLFRAVLREPAAALVLVHNHPSGDPAPSDEDVLLTRKLVAAGRLLGLTVVDHVIIGREGYFSFMDAGLLSAGA
jgi:DNA repair protein RadC